MTDMVGVWKVETERTTGYDEFSIAMGFPKEAIEAGRDIGCQFNLARDGDDWFMRVDFDNGFLWLKTTFKMGVPFSYLAPDMKSFNTSLITLKDNRFYEYMKTELDGVVTEWDVETYREGDHVITAQNKNGKIMKQYMRKAKVDMVGEWKLVPEKTTGLDAFADAIGMSKEEKEANGNSVYTFKLSQNGDAWHMKFDLENGPTYFDKDFKLNEPFTYLSPDTKTKFTNVVSLEYYHFISKVKSEKDGIVTTWEVDTYRDDDYIKKVKSKDGKSMVQFLKKV